MRGDWAARLPVFRERFRELDADIVTLQETVLTEDVDQVADMLGPGYQLAQQQDREGDGQGITTASKWPFGRVFEIDFRVTDRTHDFACTCLVTEVLMAADAASDSMRFWTGRHVIDDASVCYRSAWEATHPGEPLETYVPQNPNQVDIDWPFRGIDHILVRCGGAGPTLLIRSCRHTFDRGTTIVSDHYGLVVELEPPTDAP